jgi:hypothetical protein
MGTYLQGIKRLLVSCLNLCQFSLYILYLRLHFAPLLCLCQLCLVAAFCQVLMLTLSMEDHKSKAIPVTGLGGL